MADYYDTTVVQREARERLLTKVQHSIRKSLSADGVELIEMPLRYEKYVLGTLQYFICTLDICIVYLELSAKNSYWQRLTRKEHLSLG